MADNSRQSRAVDNAMQRWRHQSSSASRGFSGCYYAGLQCETDRLTERRLSCMLSNIARLQAYVVTPARTASGQAVTRRYDNVSPAYAISVLCMS